MKRDNSNILWLLIILLYTLPLQAAELQLAMTEAPYYANVPVEIEVRANGFEEDPQPEIHFSQPASGSLKLIAVSPNVSTRIMIINGSRTVNKTVQFTYRLRFISKKTGQYTLGPFSVTQNGNTEHSPVINLTIKTIPQNSEQLAVLALPKTVYIGQQVQASFSWWVDSSLKGKLYEQRAVVPFFNRVQDFLFIDDDSPQKGSINIETDEGVIEFPASMSSAMHNNSPHIVQTVKRTFIPLKAGTYTIKPSMLQVEKVIRWKRGFFGSTQPAQTQTLYAQDKEQKLIVKPVPLQNRPDSYSSAVGKGFTVEVSANRSIVQVGDPIRLELKIHGDHNVSQVSLPALGKMGLSPQQFSWPKTKPAGIVEEGVKRFSINVRVLDNTIQEIPALAFSWFDPYTESFQTGYSQPIALSVKKAQKISAQDVISAPQNSADSGEKPPEENTATNNTRPPAAQKTTFSFSGADLSIPQNSAQLRTVNTSFFSSASWQIFAYTLGCLMLVWAMISRRRRDIDPDILQQQNRFQEIRQQIKQASDASELASALRLLLSNSHPAQHGATRKNIDELLAQCDNLTYARTGESTKLDNSLITQALQLAKKIQDNK